MPAWLRDADLLERAAFQSNEPDRWRATRLAPLTHENGPDHYIDLEELKPRGMELRHIPSLRYEFVMALGKAEPDAPPATERPRRGVARPATDEVGMLPYAIVEHHAKLSAAFRTVRILDSIEGPAWEQQRAAARASVVEEIGQLSHFVGDAAQPLHTTIHHHGWVGDNPNGYTTESSIHARIDSGVVERHRIDADVLARALGAGEPAPAGDPASGAWDEALSLIERSFGHVEELYRLEKSGDLDGDAGEAFIVERMADGARTLASLFNSAWLASEPAKDDVDSFLRYDESGR